MHIPESANSEKKRPALSSIPSTNDVEEVNDGHAKRSKSVVCDKAEHPAAKPKSISATAKTPSLFEMNIKQIAEYDISVSDYSDKHCIHNGSVLLEDGKMVFIDRSNQLLKLLSPDFRVLSHRVLTWFLTFVTNGVYILNCARVQIPSDLIVRKAAKMRFSAELGPMRKCKRTLT